MDRYVTITQGDVFYITQCLATLEGLEKGPAGNTALAAAFALAQEYPEDTTIIVQETEYTGAGKHLQPQLSFARDNGIRIFFGDPEEEVPGENIILPSQPSMIKAKEVDLDRMRKSLIKQAMATYQVAQPTEEDIKFLAEETRTHPDYVKDVIKSL
jgi:hypothetical protein